MTDQQTTKPWWRNCADEIEIGVATGMMSAATCFTKMQELLQAESEATATELRRLSAVEAAGHAACEHLQRRIDRLEKERDSLRDEVQGLPRPAISDEDLFLVINDMLSEYLMSLDTDGEHKAMTGALWRALDYLGISALVAGTLPVDLERDALQAKLTRWHTALTAVMPSDLKDWHENNPSEWPDVAALVITGLRERRDAVEAERDALRDLLERACTGLEYYRDTAPWNDSDEEFLIEARGLLTATPHPQPQARAAAEIGRGMP